MSGRPLSDWFAAPRTLMARVRTGVRAVREALYAEPDMPKTHPHRFSDHEQVEESKYRPPASPLPSSLDEGDLPESYGNPKVVAMAVNPYLMHVYWDLKPEQFAPRDPEGSQACLRFSDPTGGSAASSFDVNIDLSAQNWYVHLWSPDKHYSVELGVKHEDGGFAALVHSEAVETPRAWPVAEVDESFIRVGETTAEPEPTVETPRVWPAAEAVVRPIDAGEAAEQPAPPPQSAVGLPPTVPVAGVDPGILPADEAPGEIVLPLADASLAGLPAELVSSAVSAALPALWPRRVFATEADLGNTADVVNFGEPGSHVVPPPLPLATVPGVPAPSPSAVASAAAVLSQDHPSAAKPLASALAPAALQPSAAASHPPALSSIPSAPDAADVLRRKLTELYALRWWQTHLASLPASAAPALLVPSRPNTLNDLTSWAENQFSPGFSSSLLSLAKPEESGG